MMSWTEKMSTRIAKKIVPNGEAYTVGQVSHGIEIFLLQMFGAVILITISILLGCAFEAIAITAMYMLLRNFSGGAHFNGVMACLLSGTALLLAAALLTKQLIFLNNWASSLLILSATIVSVSINWHHAPARHTYVEIEEHIRKRNRKIILTMLLIGCLSVQFLVYLDYKQLGHAFSFAVLLQSLLLHPLAYRAMGRIEKIIFMKG